MIGGFFNACILWNNKAVVYYCNVLRAQWDSDLLPNLFGILFNLAPICFLLLNRYQSYE
jgi:hypothetical protein